MQSVTIEQLRAASNAGGVSGVSLTGQFDASPIRSSCVRLGKSTRPTVNVSCFMEGILQFRCR